MIKSMTGFGRAEYQDDDRKITVELKSVNHRYLDFNIKMPKRFSFYETAIRSILKEYMSRGKVDVFITMEDFSKEKQALRYNQPLASRYMEYFQQMAEEFQLPNDMTVSRLGRFPEIFTMEDEEEDQEEIFKCMEKALRGAGEAFATAREKEGNNLYQDLNLKLDEMLVKVDAIIEREPEIMADYRNRLEEKTKELLGDAQIDDGRIAAEVVLFADKICTDEETVRLKSHIQNMKSVLKDDNGIGRKLDFIAQEMNREANTILSKANDLNTTNLGIDLKTIIEKVREQIQNIE